MPDTNGPVPNTAAAIQFLEQWSATGPWILVAISTNNKEIETATFRKFDNGHLKGWIDKFNGNRNIYFAVNPCIRDINYHEHPKLSDVASLSWLHVDLDPRAGEDIAAERTRCLTALQSPPGQTPPPTAIVYSGGGFQGFWRLTDPFPINGDVALADEAKRWTLQLEQDFAADNCHNVNRIMRLPGTINIPNAKKAAKGRLPELARTILFDNSRTYTLSQFKQGTLLLAAKPQGNTPNFPSNTNTKVDSIDRLDEWKVPLRIKAIALQGDNRLAEGAKTPDDSRSAWLFDFICGCVRSGVPDIVTYSIIVDEDYKISESVLDKGINFSKYANRQIGRAKDLKKNPDLYIMNEKHAVIANYGGKCVVAEEVQDTLGPVLTMQTFKDIQNRYCHKHMTVGEGEKMKSVTLGDWWLKHPERREYSSVVFSPREPVPGKYNLWHGYSVRPIPGDCSLMLAHIRENICSGEQRCYDYLIKWMAHTVQLPDSQGHTAVVLRGGRGTGKSFFVDQFGQLFGRHYLHISNSTHLVGNFNSHLQSCIVLFADEAFFAGDRKHESVLKTLITEKTIMVEPKFMNAFSSPNYVHVLMASNEQWVVPAGPDERRYFVLDVGESRRQDIEYFAAIAKQMNEGGKSAFLHHLMTMDITGFDIRTAPRTDALMNQQLISASSTDEWWYHRLEEGRLLTQHQKWEDHVAAESLYHDYTVFMSTQRMRADSRTLFNRKILSLMPGAKKESRFATVPVETDEGWGHVQYRERKTICYRVPDLLKCRLEWERRVGRIAWTDLDSKIDELRQSAEF